MRCTRRSVLRTAGMALGGAVGLTGCGTAARPVHWPAVATVPFQLWVVGIPQNAASVQIIQGFVDSTFNSRHKSVRAVWEWSNVAGAVAAIVAGAPAPLLLAGCCASWPLARPFLAPLDPYLRGANVPTDHFWSAAQLSAYQDASGLHGLPANSVCEAFLYRQDILDQLNLAYPTPDWTAADAARLWRACAGTAGGGQRRYGCTVPWEPSGPPEGLPAVVQGWGGRFASQDGTRCLLDQPAAIACGEYFMDLVWNGVATGGDGLPNPGVFSGQVAFSQGAVPTIYDAVRQLGDQVKWDFISFPRWPVRPMTILHNNFYGVNAFAANKELAWELLRWAAVDGPWQQFCMKLTAAPPGPAPLLPQWETVLRSNAPILKHKALHYWTAPIAAGQAAYDYAFFKYQPVQVNALVGAFWPSLWQHKVGVSAGFKALAQQINAVQVQAANSPPPPTAAQRRAASQAAQRLFPAQGPAVAAVPPGL